MMLLIDRLKPILLKRPIRGNEQEQLRADNNHDDSVQVVDDDDDDDREVAATSSIIRTKSIQQSFIDQTKPRNTWVWYRFCSFCTFCSCFQCHTNQNNHHHGGLSFQHQPFPIRCVRRLWYFYHYCIYWFIRSSPRIFCISIHFRTNLRNMIQYGLLCFVMIIVTLWLGSEYENYHIQKAAGTTHFYNEQPTVCSFYYNNDIDTNNLYSTTNNDTTHTATTNSDSNQEEFLFKTFSSPIEAYEIQLNTSQNDDDDDDDSILRTNIIDNNHHNKSVVIAHCGECGACSNIHDMSLYDVTKDTLFRSTGKCAKRGLIWGRKTSTNCMEAEVGLTSACTRCWIENIICDLRVCVFTCMWYGLFFDRVDGPGKLNACTTCDEKRCGPAFIQCAGVNRRRSGIISDIVRNQEQEVCTKVQPPHWWNHSEIQDRYHHLHNN